MSEACSLQVATHCTARTFLAGCGTQATANEVGFLWLEPCGRCATVEWVGWVLAVDVKPGADVPCPAGPAC